MLNIHIALVGGQAYPVYLAIMAYKPDRVILICSEQTIEPAKRIADEIQIETQFLLFDPVDLNKIFRKTEECAVQINESDFVSVNISGGTKPWALAFFSIFSKMKNASIIYVDQNCYIWDFLTGESRTAELDMKALFKLHGTPLVDYIPFLDYTMEDHKMAMKIKDMYHYNARELYLLIAEFEQKEQLQTASTPKGSLLTWDQKAQTFRLFLKTKDKSDYKTQLSSPHIRQLLLNTGWFEYEVAKMISGWNKAKEIRLNCKFLFQDNKSKNEIDIIVNTGTKLLFVECKTNIHTTTDIDKFNSAVKNYGGMGSKALIVTLKELSQKAKEKCRDYDILYFSLSENMLGQDPNKMLYLLLNNELSNLNPK